MRPIATNNYPIITWAFEEADRQGVSRKALSEELGLYDQHTVTRWRSGDTQPRLAHLSDLVQVLGYTLTPVRTRMPQEMVSGMTALDSLLALGGHRVALIPISFKVK